MDGGLYSQGTSVCSENNNFNRSRLSGRVLYSRLVCLRSSNTRPSIVEEHCDRIFCTQIGVLKELGALHGDVRRAHESQSLLGIQNAYSNLSWNIRTWWAREFGVYVCPKHLRRGSCHYSLAMDRGSWGCRDWKMYKWDKFFELHPTVRFSKSHGTLLQNCCWTMFSWRIIISIYRLLRWPIRYQMYQKFEE